jgi:hypothetical protein
VQAVSETCRRFRRRARGFGDAHAVSETRTRFRKRAARFRKEPSASKIRARSRKRVEKSEKSTVAHGKRAALANSSMWRERRSAGTGTGKRRAAGRL